MAGTPSNDKQRLTAKDLEQLTTHQVAAMLSDIVLILRRLPDVPFTDLQQAEETPATPDLVDKAHERVNGRALPNWTQDNNR